MDSRTCCTADHWTWFTLNAPSMSYLTCSVHAPRAQGLARAPDGVDSSALPRRGRAGRRRHHMHVPRGAGSRSPGMLKFAVYVQVRHECSRSPCMLSASRSPGMISASRSPGMLFASRSPCILHVRQVCFTFAMYAHVRQECFTFAMYAQCFTFATYAHVGHVCPSPPGMSSASCGAFSIRGGGHFLACDYAVGFT